MTCPEGLKYHSLNEGQTEDAEGMEVDPAGFEYHPLNGDRAEGMEVGPAGFEPATKRL